MPANDMAGATRAMLLACLVSASCSAVEKPASERPQRAGQERAAKALPGPSPAICDASGCALFCLRVGGCAGGSSCLGECQARCGDGYFDDRDGPVMACVLGASGDSCAALRRCCDVDFTSQLCARD